MTNSIPGTNLAAIVDEIRADSGAPHGSLRDAARPGAQETTDLVSGANVLACEAVKAGSRSIQVYHRCMPELRGTGPTLIECHFCHDGRVRLR